MPPSKLYQENQFVPDQSFCDKMASFFQTKVQLIYDELVGKILIPCSTSTSESANLNRPAMASQLNRFTPLSTERTNDLLLAAKSGSPTHPCLPAMIHLVSNKINNQLALLLNNIMSSGIFPTSCKKECIRPILRKPSLDPHVVENYRPICCLPLAAKY